MSHIPFDAQGHLLRRDAVTMGFDDNWLRRMRDNGALIKLRHGAYGDPAVWFALTPAGRHVFVAQAVLKQYDDRVALSHGSAIVARGGPSWGLDLSTVHLTNLFARGDRRRAGITHHRGRTTVGDITLMNGHWITSPARNALETAVGLAADPAVAVLDWALHEQLATPAELAWLARHPLREWPHSIQLPDLVAAADPKTESVGETRTRRILVRAGLAPESQWEVRRPSGAIAGTVDFRLPKLGMMVEFDGMVKYGRLLKPGQSINDVILAERRREVLLEELTGLRMFRLIWPDLDDEQRLIDRVLRSAALRNIA